MANIMQNRVDAILTPADMQKIRDCINTIISLLPEGGNLTLDDDEMGSLTSLDVDNKAFVEDAIVEIRNNGKDILPHVVSANQMQNDLTLFEQMDELQSLIKKADNLVDYVLRAAANEAFNMGSLAYKTFKASASGSIPNAKASYDKLKLRYKDNGGGAKPQETP